MTINNLINSKNHEKVSIGTHGSNGQRSEGADESNELWRMCLKSFTLPVVDVIKLFWGKSGKSRFPLKP